MSILHQIYTKTYTPAKPNLPFLVRLKERDFYESVETAMGAEFMERHRDNLTKAGDLRKYASFREGFRLGVALMLELR